MDLRSIAPTQAFGLVIAIGILLVTLLVDPPATIGHRLHLLFGIFLSTVILWITRPIPYSISSLLCVILLFAFGVTDTFQDAVIGFASSLVFFIILLLLIGKSIAIVDLDEWVANRLVSATTTPRGSVRRLAGTVLLLAFLMPSGTARTVTFMPIIDQINELYGLGPDSSFRRAAYYVIGHVNHIGSTALMTGGGLAIVTAELINSMVRPMTWLEWAFFMIPPAGALFLVASFSGIYLYRVPADFSLPAPSDQTDDEISTPEPLTGEQLVVLATLTGAICLWILGSFLGFDAIIPAMLVVVILSLPGVGILTANHFKEISWGIVFLIGAMLSVLEVMDELEGIDLIVSVLFSSIPPDTAPVVIIALLFGFAIGVRAIFSSVAAAIVILLPIVLEFATVLGIDGLYTSFSLMLVLVATSVLPFNVSTVLLAYERGPLSVREVFLLGVLTIVLSWGIVALSWTVYWPMVEGVIEPIFG